MDLEKGEFYLGSIIDAATGETRDERLTYDSADLTTHGVIVGMTGSGKTGLGIDVLEEALLNGVSCLVIDPKGDMGNLLLSFPDFQPADFRPWIDESEAERDGVAPDELAVKKAELWKSGLEKAGITGERLQRLNDTTEITVYTPGSGAGVGLNVLGSLAAPDIDW
jgi:DNA helicase HerA-like ATPase